MSQPSDRCLNDDPDRVIQWVKDVATIGARHFTSSDPHHHHHHNHNHSTSSYRDRDSLSRQSSLSSAVSSYTSEDSTESVVSSLDDQSSVSVSGESFITAPTSILPQSASASAPSIKQQQQHAIIHSDKLETTSSTGSFDSVSLVSGVSSPREKERDQKRREAENLIDMTHSLLISIWPTQSKPSSSSSTPRANSQPQQPSTRPVSAVYAQMDAEEQARAKAQAEADAKAEVGLRIFISEILRRSRSSCATLFGAKEYLVRFNASPMKAAAQAQNPTLTCPRRTFLCALVLAHKFLHDRVYSEKAWGGISGLSAKEIAHTERALIKVLDHRLFFHPPTSSSSPELKSVSSNPDLHVKIVPEPAWLSAPGVGPPLIEILPALPSIVSRRNNISGRINGLGQGKCISLPTIPTPSSTSIVNNTVSSIPASIAVGNHNIGGWARSVSSYLPTNLNPASSMLRETSIPQTPKLHSIGSAFQPIRQQPQPHQSHKRPRSLSRSPLSSAPSSPSTISSASDEEVRTPGTVRPAGNWGSNKRQKVSGGAGGDQSESEEETTTMCEEEALLSGFGGGVVIEV